MANETLTENLVYDHFKNDPLFSDKTMKVILERQTSANPKIDELLQGQSKGKGNGNGRPDFILTFPTNSDYVISIECKAEISKHESNDHTKTENIRDYAVDGALHYARALSKGFDVLAIAVSGETKDEMMVSHFLWKKGSDSYEEMTKDKNLLTISNYLQLFRNEHFSDSLLHINIVEKATELNELLHGYNIKELDRCTLISAVLLALTEDSFQKSYSAFSDTKSLFGAILAAVNTSLKKHSLQNFPAMITEYSKLNGILLFTNERLLNTDTHKSRQTLEILKIEIVEYLYKNIYPLLNKADRGFDVLGKFYSEFVRYAGSQASLGLVLTPQHITDLFCDFAEITKDDILYDPCCGTGGFLIAGMKRMFQLAGNDQNKREKIRTQQIVGCEIDAQMYTYTCSNMMMRGDGKSNVYQGSCFDMAPIIKEHKPTVAFLNPPYKKGNSAYQMQFIKHALDMVSSQNGRVVAIVQMSCAIKNESELKAIKKQMLDKHHLKAVISMPDDLFYPVGVVTCVMVFEANKPNKGKETWFGYFKNDGFEKRKHLGRIDARNKYAGQREKLLVPYINKKEIAGWSVVQEVTADNEWCAEAYMETDYSTLCDEDFEKKVKEYVAFKFLNGID